MITKNGMLGMDGFYWWLGVVENRNDPLKIGRVQVRIFGWHTPDLKLIPSKDLPWAHPILPGNNADDFKTPKEGAYIFGFFFDGPSGQFPGYLGVMPGIPMSAALQTETPQAGFQDVRTPAQLASAPTVPASVQAPTDGSGATVTNQPAKTFPDVAGEPTVPPLAINDPANPPAQIAQRLKDTVKNIAGPDNQNLATAIAGAAAGAQSALTGALANLKSLVPDLSSLSSALTGQIPSLGAGLQQAAGLASKLTGTTITAPSADVLAKAQSAITSQLADAQKAATAAAAQAQASATAALGNLQSSAGSIANDISANLSKLSSGSITTQFPVVLNSDNTPVVAINGLQVPLNQVASMQADLQSQLTSLQTQLTSMLK